MLSATCHCGAVGIELPQRPAAVTNCNCSICRRYGVLWAYYEVGAVRISGHPEHTEAYVWGDRMLQFVRCRHCGCVTHWEPLPGQSQGRMAVNVRNFEPEVLGDFRIRRFDGAQSWRFLDEP